MSTGNYEYRLILRCRQEARARFSQMRKDVLEKMELLDQKHGEGGPSPACSPFHKWHGLRYRQAPLGILSQLAAAHPSPVLCPGWWASLLCLPRA